MGMLAKIRRMHLRDALSLREISRRTGLSRNTVRHWLRQDTCDAPRYPKRQRSSVLDGCVETLECWLHTDRHRPKREQRTARQLYLQLCDKEGYQGSYSRVCAYVRTWRGKATLQDAYVPLHFSPGEAFQFDWSHESIAINGVKQRLDVAHIKLCASRVFWLVAYPRQSHEMLFDAHTQAFIAFDGVPQRGIYDNLKTVVDRVGRGKDRQINARFKSLHGHYLFDPDCCTVAAGWEKGIVEKHIRDCRSSLWAEAAQRNWPDLSTLNAWLANRCRKAWSQLRHPKDPTKTLAQAWQEERPFLMRLPRPFDGYLERCVRVTSTGLIHFQRNRYSVPIEAAHRVVSLRVYPQCLMVVADGRVLARHQRCFERDQVFYDWQHYIPLLERKPGALRNGAPFTHMPAPLQALQRHLLRRQGGDRVMAKVLAAVAQYGLEAVLVAVELVLESHAPEGEHVLNVLARLADTAGKTEEIAHALPLSQVPQANLQRYDALCLAQEVIGHGQ